MAANKKSTKKSTGKQTDLQKAEQIGYHKGCLATLMKERQELARIVGIVDQLMQMNMAALSDLGVDLQKEGLAQSTEQKPAAVPRKKVPIDQII